MRRTACLPAAAGAGLLLWATATPAAYGDGLPVALDSITGRLPDVPPHVPQVHLNYVTPALAQLPIVGPLTASGKHGKPAGAASAAGALDKGGGLAGLGGL
ncbi:hypothetical protein ACMATS_05855 [Streptoverticillium reticulum]|uniref:hypothetical protein n=1 Tax=Streptoverticillium reticulum TaxID=1433415 RepID=UPI0039BFC523